MSLPNRSLVRYYNKRGTAEQWIKEGRQTTSWTRLSCHRFRSNEVRLQLAMLAYNLGNPADQELVADEFAASAAEDRRSAGQAYPVILAAAG